MILGHVIDFDQTICTGDFPEMGSPADGCKQALLYLKNGGYKVWISSCRFNPASGLNIKEQKEIVRNYLINNNLYFDDILDNHKPIALMYWDDRANVVDINNGGWAEALKNWKQKEKYFVKKVSKDLDICATLLSK